MAHRRPDVTII